MQSVAATSYVERPQVERLLGILGMGVLRRVLDLVEDSTARGGWPLTKVQVRYIRDPEMKDWKYVLLVFVFDCTFERADEHLHEFYAELDSLAEKLNEEERKLLGRLLFFDIETPAGVPSV